MSMLSYCDKCGGWQWRCSPNMIEELMKIKLKQLEEMKKSGHVLPPGKPYQWPPLRPGECGCDRS